MKRQALAEAERCLRRALAIKETRLGPRHLDTQNTATELWNVLEEKGGQEAEMEALDAKHGI